MLAGLDPYLGFYHVERASRPTLVLGPTEEFRPLIADSVVATLLNNRYLSPKEFRSGGPERPVILDLKGYQKVLRLLEVQSRILVAAIEGLRENYQPFRSR